MAMFAKGVGSCVGGLMWVRSFSELNQGLVRSIVSASSLASIPCVSFVAASSGPPPGSSTATVKPKSPLSKLLAMAKPNDDKEKEKEKGDTLSITIEKKKEKEWLEWRNSEDAENLMKMVADANDSKQIFSIHKLFTFKGSPQDLAYYIEMVSNLLRIKDDYALDFALQILGGLRRRERGTLEMDKREFSFVCSRLLLYAVECNSQDAVQTLFEILSRMHIMNETICQMALAQHQKKVASGGIKFYTNFMALTETDPQIMFINIQIPITILREFKKGKSNNMVYNASVYRLVFEAIAALPELNESLTYDPREDNALEYLIYCFDDLGSLNQVPSTEIFNPLLRYFYERDDIETLKQLFEIVVKLKIPLDNSTYDTLLQGLGSDLETAVLITKIMSETKHPFDKEFCLNLFMGCKASKNIQLAEEVFRKVENTPMLDNDIANALLSVYCESDVTKAIALFKDMEDRKYPNVKVNSVAYGQMLKLYLLVEELDKILEWIYDIPNKDAVVFGEVLNYYADQADVERVQEYLAVILEQFTAASLTYDNYFRLIRLYCQKNEEKKGLYFLREMIVHKVRLKAEIFEELIKCYLNLPDPETKKTRVSTFLKHMEKLNVAISPQIRALVKNEDLDQEAVTYLQQSLSNDRLLDIVRSKVDKHLQK